MMRPGWEEEEEEEERWRPYHDPFEWITGWTAEPMASPIRHSTRLTDGVKSPSARHSIARNLRSPDISSRSSLDSLPLFIDASSNKQHQTPNAALSIPAVYSNSAETREASIPSGITDYEMSDQDVAAPCIQANHSQLPLDILSDGVLRRVSPATLARCRSVCRDWNSFLTRSEFYNRYGRREARVPWLLNIGPDKIAGFNFHHQSWSLLTYDIAAHYKVISAWSAGNLIVLLLQTPGLQECTQEMSLHLWNPLTQALQCLPPFNQITNDYSFGFSPDKILAIGSCEGDSIGLTSIVEVLDLNAPLTNWRLVGALPSRYLVEPDQQLIQLHGSFYALCMSPHQNTMVAIHAQEPWFTLHAIPRELAWPKLALCNDTIFLIADVTIHEALLLWKFLGGDGWSLINRISCPALGLPPPRIISILGIRNLLCFCLQHNFVIVYDLSQDKWQCLTLCPLKITHRPLVWEP